MKVAGAETRKCPKEFQDRITRMFGRNQFGDPYFKIVWGQSEFIRMGNIWRDRWGNERKGFRETYQCHGSPCWVIMRWKQPAHYGSPRAYYESTFDSFSGLHFLGEYPWRGRYEIVHSMMWQEMTEGKIIIELIPSLNPHTGIIENVPVKKKVGQELIVHHMPLSHVLIDKIIPLLIKMQGISKEELAAISQANQLAQHQKDVAELSEVMAANMPTYIGPVSYSRQGCRTSILDKKMEAIQKVWNRELRSGRRLARGFQTADRPLRSVR